MLQGRDHMGRGTEGTARSAKRQLKHFRVTEGCHICRMLSKGEVGKAGREQTQRPEHLLPEDLDVILKVKVSLFAS